MSPEHTFILGRVFCNTARRKEDIVPTTFEKDILPLFRADDINHMKRYGVMLDDYKYMSDPADNHKNAQAVEDTLRDQSMPPGGPYWSEEQLALYANWRGEGYLEK